MRKRSFYIAPGFISEQSKIMGSDAFHIASVLRMKTGDDIEIFDGIGNRYLARILYVSSKVVQIVLLDKLLCKKESDVSITLAQALLKDGKMDILVRQLTELGFNKWVPFSSNRSVGVVSEKRLDSKMKRWRKISIEAVKQCQRSIVPEISCVKKFSDIMEMQQTYDVSFIFWEGSFCDSGFLKHSNNHVRKILIVVGPEGGFEEKEIKEAKSHGFVVASLGPRILRAETASVVACSLVQYFFGDFIKKA